MITLDEFLMDRHEEYPLSFELLWNAIKLLASVNYIRGRYNNPLGVSSGYRPGKYNKKAGGAKSSAHMSCEAIDLKDYTGDFAKWCLANLEELKKAGLYLEDPSYTKGWVHLQTRRPKSGNRVFIPY